jgi:outer membrane protein assembly factor BamB
MKNNVYAFDADDPAEDYPFWKRNLGRPVPYQLIPLNWGSVFLQYNIEPFIGITSTPVIDAGKGLMWLSVKSMESETDLRYYLYALDIKTGKTIAQSKQIDAGTGDDRLDGRTNLQRPGLLRVNGMVYLGFGSQQDGGFYHGWVVAFDEDTLEQKYVFCTTPGNPLAMGGIWQAGNGPAADATGNIYVMTANGAYKDGQQYGTSFVKLSPELKVVDWFTPSNYLYLWLEDIDLGSSGPMLLPNSGTPYPNSPPQLVGGGKQGRIYLLDSQNMGHLQPSGSVAPALQVFKVSSHWTINWLSWLIPVFGYHHIHGAPVYWDSAQQGPLVYVWPEESKLKVYRYDPVKHFTTKPYLVGPKAPTGMPGGILSISANQNQNGLLWAVTPLIGDAFVSTVRGVLRVFDANSMEQLWNSATDMSDDFNFAKYSPPTVTNGKVYLATFSDALNVYGLTAPPKRRPEWTTAGRQPIKSRGRGHGHGRMTM